MTNDASASLAAAIDGAALWPHNRHVINDPLIETAVLDALAAGSITGSEAMFGQRPHPRLVVCDPDVVAYSLIETLADDTRWNLHAPCDRCREQVQPVSRLWVPAGASVVEIHCCFDCAAELDRDYSNLVWR